MKKIIFALVIALLVAGQVFLPVAAASPTSKQGTTDCGDTYVVSWGDTLAKIAAKCGTTVSDILSRNPSIYNANLIFAGQSLRLSGDPVVIPPTGNGGTYTVRRGDTLGSIAAMFGTNIWTLLSLNTFIWNPSIIYAGWVLNLPSGSGGPYPPPYYPPYYPPSPYPGGVTVSVSKYKVAAGGSITVSVTGFPKNANIDYRLGRSGYDYSLVEDGLTDANGADSATITIPDSANEGEYWVVRVVTTELKKGTDITTGKILILP